MTGKSSGRAKCKNLVAPGGGSSSSRFGQYGGGRGEGVYIYAKESQVNFLEK